MSSPSTACATGLHAVGEAFRTLQRQEASLMLAGATDACIDAISINGFCRMRALSTAHNGTPETASRPFESSRDGFVMGEGAGGAVLSLTRVSRLCRCQMQIARAVLVDTWIFCCVNDVCAACW
jgi:3-oxoacyl-(acyl-carrier-protein) synthase